MRLIAQVLIFALLSGCAALNMKRPVSEQDTGKVKNVGVLSALGPDMHGVHVGTTVFTNWRYRADVALWKIDDVAAQHAVGLLSTRKGIAAGRIVAPRSTEDLYTSRTSTQIKKDEVFALAAAQGFDTLVLLRRDRYDNAPFYEPGYGIFYRSTFGSTRPCVYAMYLVEVYDVKSKASLGWERAATCLSAQNEIPFKKGFEEFSPSERERVKALLEAEIKRTVEDTLKRVGLVAAAGSLEMKMAMVLKDPSPNFIRADAHHLAGHT